MLHNRLLLNRSYYITSRFICQEIMQKKLENAKKSENDGKKFFGWFVSFLVFGMKIKMLKVSSRKNIFLLIIGTKFDTI